SLKKRKRKEAYPNNFRVKIESGIHYTSIIYCYIMVQGFNFLFGELMLTHVVPQTTGIGHENTGAYLKSITTTLFFYFIILYNLMYIFLFTAS
ncbi:hypothetical protein ACJX0J_035094, partial [Zea mays]